MYAIQPTAELLVVGHTDATGSTGAIAVSLCNAPRPSWHICRTTSTPGTNTIRRRRTDVAFVLGSATLRKEGRKKLRALAANELAEFRDRSSRLCVYGFADRIDRRWFNKALSNTRADNTTQALKDCLGSDFVATVRDFVATVHAKGFGEEALRFLDYFLDFPDEAAQPEWRRSFAILNAHSMVSLDVRDLEDVKK